MTPAGDSLLLVAGGVRTLATGQPSAKATKPPRAVQIEDRRIGWVGDEPAAAPPARRTVDLGEAWIAPAFVDAHVHGTATGLAVTGLELGGAGSAAQALGRLRAFAESTDAPVVLGHGWDDFGWPEGRPMTAAEVADAAPGRRVLLARTDLHSCVVDPATLRELPLATLEGADRDADGQPTGWLREAASEAARRHILAQLSVEQLTEARTAACVRAAEQGIASLHEMGHPGLSGWEDAMAWQGGRWDVEVVTWWAELDPGLGCLEHGMRPGGDLFLDGSIGSRTAAVTRPYLDHGGHGKLFHPDEAVAAFFGAATAAGCGAGVHAIGDRAIEQAVNAIEAAAGSHGVARVRAARHRIEHVELPSRAQVRRMAHLGVVASVQPAFDAAWGGDDGLYAQRFGTAAARASNPLAWFAREGAPMAFGSDSTVTPLDPWAAVAAAEHHRGGLSLDRSTAFAAHVLGGRYAAGQDGEVGAIVVGMRADLAVWNADPLSVDDVRSLRCLATLVSGRVAHGHLQ
jgi:predicted amidohydrolase YtcJ